MFLWALATLWWRVTEPGTTLNYLALVVAATSAIKSFFNLNPLLRGLIERRCKPCAQGS